MILVILLVGCVSPEAAERSARCLGWCEAHGYERSIYLDESPGLPVEWSTDECWCAERVGPGAALVGEPRISDPVDLPAEAPAAAEP